MFGLDLLLDNDGNVILTEGLVLQDARIWSRFLERDIIPENNSSELYFEESDIENFICDEKNSVRTGIQQREKHRRYCFL